jgi:hypothetical protein
MPAFHADSEESATLGMAGGAKAVFSSAEPHLQVGRPPSRRQRVKGSLSRALRACLGGGRWAVQVKLVHKGSGSTRGRAPPGEAFKGEMDLGAWGVTGTVCLVFCRAWGGGRVM